MWITLSRCYASDGAVVGDDVRATALDRLMAGWA